MPDTTYYCNTNVYCTSKIAVLLWLLQYYCLCL